MKQIDEYDDVPKPDHAEAMGIPKSSYSLQMGPTSGTSTSQEVTEPKDTVWGSQQGEQRGLQGSFPVGGFQQPPLYEEVEPVKYFDLAEDDLTFDEWCIHRYRGPVAEATGG